MKQTHVVNNNGVAAAPRESAFFRKAAVLLEAKCSRSGEEKLFPPKNMVLFGGESANGMNRSVMAVGTLKHRTVAKPLSKDEVKKVLEHKGRNGELGYLVQVDPEELRVPVNLAHEVTLLRHAVAKLPKLSLVGGGGAPYREEKRDSLNLLKPFGEVPSGAVEKLFLFVPAAADRVAKTALAFAADVMQAAEKKSRVSKAQRKGAEAPEQKKEPVGASTVAFGGVGDVEGWDAPFQASSAFSAAVPEMSEAARRLNLP